MRLRTRVLRLACTTVFLASFLTALAPRTTALVFLFWTSPKNKDIGRANLDGSGKKTLQSGLPQPSGLAASCKNIFWSQDATGSNTPVLRKADLEGKNVEDLLKSPTRNGVSVQAVVVSGKKLYWTELTSGKIRCSDLDGKNPVDLVTGLSPDDAARTLAVRGNKLYWTTQKGELFTYDVKAKKGPTKLAALPQNPGSPAGLVAGKDGLYMAFPTTGKIVRYDFEGKNPVELLDGLMAPSGLAIFQGKLYWTEWAGGAAGKGKIGTSALNGAGKKDLVTGITAPIGIAVNCPEGSSLWLLAGGALGVVCFVRRKRAG